jgi:hypothetical protein
LFTANSGAVSNKLGAPTQISLSPCHGIVLRVHPRRDDGMSGLPSLHLLAAMQDRVNSISATLIQHEVCSQVQISYLLPCAAQVKQIVRTRIAAAFMFASSRPD